MEASQGQGSALQRAWRLYGEGRFAEAAQALTGVSPAPGDPEVDYALGLIHKRLGNRDQARESFLSVIEVLGKQERQVRATMLRRLAQGHVNVLERGSWDLEAETWQHQ